MRFGADTRAASVPLTHALSLGITALLVAGLLLGSGQLLDRQAERVTEKSLRDVRESVANELTRIDRLSSSRPGTNVSSRVVYPACVGGTGYDIHLVDRGGSAVVFTNASGVSTRVRLQFDSDVCGRSVNGGPVELVYDDDEDCLTINPTSR